MIKTIRFSILTLANLLVLNFCALAQGPDTTQIKLISNMGNVNLPKQQTLPIQIWGDLILIRAKVNGIEGDFLWDNGFAFSALDKNFANKIKLSPLKEQKGISATDGNNVAISMQCELGNVALGNVQISGTPFTIIDFKAMMGNDVKPVGIIGSTIIKKINWKFDFDQNTVTLSLKPFEEKDGIKLPFEIDAYNNSKIRFGINGYADYAAIDFGYNGDDVTLPKGAVRIFGPAKKMMSTGHMTSSVSGISRLDTTYSIKDFKYWVGDQNTVLPHKFNINLTASNDHAVIGNRFFRNYNCIINNTTGQIILSKRKLPINVIPENTYGIILAVNNGKMKISSFSDNPNVKSHPDLKLMDEIESINDRKIADFKDPSQIRDYQIKLLLQNAEMKLKRTDGKTFVLRPALDTYR